MSARFAQNRATRLPAERGIEQAASAAGFWCFCCFCGFCGWSGHVHHGHS